MLTRSLAPSATRAILHRAPLSTSRPTPSPPPAHPASTRTAHDALYADQGPSAAAENVTQPATFPYSQTLASSTTTPPPSPSPAPSQLPLGLEPETPVQEPPVSRSRRPVGAFRGGSVPHLPPSLSLSPSRQLTLALHSIIGFLLGLTAVGGYGYFRVLDDYRRASEKLLTSVEELKTSTEQVRRPFSLLSSTPPLFCMTTDSAPPRPL